MKKFESYRNTYKTFIYDKYEIQDINDKIKITYYFEIPNLAMFTPSIQIDKKNIKKLDETSRYLIFNIGMIELISYYKVVCPKEIIVNAGYINDEQIRFFKKLYYYGLGEFLYINNIKISENDFVNITCNVKGNMPKNNYIGTGNLIPIGGGKDSCVTLEVLKDIKSSNTLFTINKKSAMEECIKMAEYKDSDVINIQRELDKKIIELNNQGYLNGHTPFSSLVAFISLFIAYENNKKNIVLSCENSANEPTVKNEKVNHQYSKTIEFENDFNRYVKENLKLDISYFSLLRPLNEITIAYLFSKYKKYHKVFKSCNVGSKNKEWVFCLNCSKCLFTYIILGAFLSEDEMIDIFKENLLDKKELLDDFKSLIGENESKPFECVGTIKEVRYAVSRIIEKSNNKLSYLLKYYKDNYKLEIDNNILNEYHDNNLDEEFTYYLKKELKKWKINL